MISLDTNIVAVALPSIARSFKADFASVEWIISAYTLTFASCLMPAGTGADRYGRRRTLVIGLIIFAFASLLCGLSQNVEMLIGARALQGVGAALQLSSALAILSNVFQGAARARAFAFWGSVIGAGVATGPVVGGLITKNFGWVWAFNINVPIGIILSLMALKYLPESRDLESKRLDIAGSMTFSGALFLMTFALISANEVGWTDARVVACVLTGLASFIAFFFVEKAQARPMLDFSIFKNKTFVGSTLGHLGYAASLMTMFTYIPVFIQNGLSCDPQTAGLMSLPFALPIILVPKAIESLLAHRLSGRDLCGIGFLLLTVGLVLMAVGVSAFQYSAIVPGIIIAGTGAGFLNGEVAKVSMSSIPPERAGMGSGFGGTMRFSGLVIGFAALGAILYSGVESSVSRELPHLSSTTQRALIRMVTNGNFAKASAKSGVDCPISVLRASLGTGYRGMLFSAAGIAGLCAVLSWLLIDAKQTAAVPRGIITEAPVALAD